MPSYTIKRRSFLSAGIGLAACGALPAFAAAEPFFRRHHLKIGVQLYAFGGVGRDPSGNYVLTDLRGTLAKASACGYQAVEMPFEFANVDARKLKADLAPLDLACPSAQSELGPRVDLSKLAEGLHTVGADTCVTQDLLSQILDKPISSWQLSAEDVQKLDHLTADDWRRGADFLNKKGAALKAQGIKLCYHNHNFEFAPVGDTYGYEILIRNTETGSVYFQLDIGWCATAGKDPATVFAKDKGRYWSAHIKDIKASTRINYVLHDATHAQMDNAVVGQGKLNWPRILEAAYDSGVRRFFVEHEDPNRTVAALKASREYLSHVAA